MQNRKQSFDPQKQNRGSQDRARKIFSDRSSEINSMNWDPSGRDYHSSNDEQRGNFDRSTFGQNKYEQGSNYPKSDYGTSNFNKRNARSDAEYAFGSNRSPSEREHHSLHDDYYGRNSSYDNSQYTTNFGAGNTGNRSAYRNREDVMGSRGSISKRDLSQYAQNDFGNTHYGEGELYGRGRDQSSFNTFDDAPYTTENNREMKSSNSHFGKGPKGYKRSDARIQEDAQEALTHDHDVDASEIEVSVKDGIVTLSGTVSERKMKRLAEDCVEKVSGVIDVKNEISTSGFSLFGGHGKQENKTSASTRGSKSASNSDMM